MSVGVSIKTFTDRNGVKHSVEGGGGGTDPAIIEELEKKIDKVEPELEDHLAAFDDEGGLKDGGAKTQFAAASHSHTIAGVTGLQTALDGKAASNHNHNSAYEAKKTVIKIETDGTDYDIASTSETDFDTLFDLSTENKPIQILVLLAGSNSMCEFDASFVTTKGDGTDGSIVKIYFGEYLFTKTGTVNNKGNVTWTTGLTVARNGLLPTLS